MPEVIYDPIHRTITFSDREKIVIDHPFVQRLRFIRQLGLKSFVYPGAVHDRFGHALGAMHLAGKVYHAINEKCDVFKKLRPTTQIYIRELLRFSALLHDVGHGPFSHASETLMPKLGTLDVPISWYTEYHPKQQALHEDYSVLLVRTLGSAKEKIFSSDEAQDIASIIHKKIKPSSAWYKKFRSRAEAIGYHAFLHRLVSGELDVDRMDYLLRDSYFTGIPYGNYDLPWLLHTLSAITTKDWPKLVIHESGLRAYEDFLLARYHMFLQVYFHRATSIFEYYVEQAIREREIELQIPSDAYAYAELRDGSVIEAMYQAAKHSKNQWSRLLVRREPATLIHRAEATDKQSMRRYRTIVTALREAKIPFIERTGKRTLAEQGEGRFGASGILIAQKFIDQYEYVPVEEASQLLKKYNEQIDRRYLYVAHADYRRARTLLRVRFK